MKVVWEERLAAYQKTIKAHPNYQTFIQLEDLEAKFQLDPKLYFDVYFLDSSKTSDRTLVFENTNLSQIESALVEVIRGYRVSNNDEHSAAVPGLGADDDMIDRFMEGTRKELGRGRKTPFSDWGALREWAGWPKTYYESKDLNVGGGRSGADERECPDRFGGHDIGWVDIPRNWKQQVNRKL